jgi:signal transduction histidine kinase/CheY-like chemotaxis protein
MSWEPSRLDTLLEVLMAYARRDFTPRIEISEQRDELDAIATGINLLAEELQGEVASLRELEAAHAELQATQAQLVVAEKFVAIGQLASGVTHELNNPASWVRLGLQHARRRLAEARALARATSAQLEAMLGEIDGALADVQNGTERIWGVIGDLRTLSRVGPDETTELDLNAVVRQACQLARPAYQGVARLVLDLGELPTLHGNSRRLGQLITNLVINAAQAIDTGGSDHEIVITTRADRERVMLAVEDSGPGIPPELHERVFDPYFTTKPSEIGTGLGLALVRKIAQHHGGQARVTAGARTGARIEVMLPIRHEGAAAAAPVLAPVPAASPRRGRLLIIDDEPLLLQALAEALRDDHDVVTSLGGADAVALIATDQAFDLILCDLQMPAVDGMAVHEAIARSAPQLLGRVAFMSGGVVTVRAHQFLQRVRPRVIDKPIQLDEVLALV